MTPTKIHQSWKEQTNSKWPHFLVSLLHSKTTLYPHPVPVPYSCPVFNRNLHHPLTFTQTALSHAPWHTLKSCCPFHQNSCCLHRSSLLQHHSIHTGLALGTGRSHHYLQRVTWGMSGGHACPRTSPQWSVSEPSFFSYWPKRPSVKLLV